MNILTKAQMRAVEQRAFDSGTEFITLMENAGSACAEIIEKHLIINSDSSFEVCVVCGSGKNGGDGFVIARKLYLSGYKVCVVLAGGPAVDSDAIDMFNLLKAIPIEIIDYIPSKMIAEKLILRCGLIIDAIFGTGFKSNPNDETAQLIRVINRSNAKVFSVDIPSGIVCDTGEVSSEYIKAQHTIAISSLKPAHILVPGISCCGEIIIADIGITSSCYEAINDGVFYTLNEIEIKEIFPAISISAHKGNFGHVLSVCGSKTMQGAAVIAAKSAVCSGAGLVTAAFPDCAYSAIASKLTEPILLPLKSNELGTLSFSAVTEILNAAEKSDALLLGCGLGVNSDTKAIIRELIKEVHCPIILDADGINSLVDSPDILSNAYKDIIITPHPGEMSRISGLTVSQVQTNRLNIARDVANRFGITVVLKGANTVIANCNYANQYINTTGNPGMATGGSGDFLAGILTSFIAQGIPSLKAAEAAVYIHGLTGDITADRISKRGLTPSACLDLTLCYVAL